MKSLIRTSLLLILCTFSVQSIYSQVIVVDNYDELNLKYLNVEDDTMRVVNFWATWCKPCVEELPYFEQLNENLKGSKVKIFLVSLDFKSQLEKRLFPFVEENKLTSEVVAFIDPSSNEWIPKIDQEWSGAIPATYISKGNTNWFREGNFESVDEIMEQINKLN